MNVGDIVRVKVLDVNTEAKRISLSIREVLEDEAMEQMPASNDLDEYAIVDVPTPRPGGRARRPSRWKSPLRKRKKFPAEE